jgi:hypothetical protein
VATKLIREQQPETNKATVSSGFDSVLSGAVGRIGTGNLLIPGYRKSPKSTYSAGSLKEK